MDKIGQKELRKMFSKKELKRRNKMMRIPIARPTIEYDRKDRTRRKNWLNTYQYKT